MTVPKLILPLLLLCGCAHHEMAKPQVSLMPWSNVSRTKKIPSLAKLYTARPTTVIVSWQNQPSAYASNIVTGLEFSADLRNWSKLAELPYATSNALTLTYTNQMGFFRAYNRALNDSVTLLWDEVEDATVQGYRIYTGVMPRVYTNFVTVQPKTNTSVLMCPLVHGTTYYFSATAYNTIGESDFSNEISYTDEAFNTPPHSLNFAACQPGTEGTKGKRM